MSRSNRVFVLPLVRCLKCQKLMAVNGVHAPRWVDRDGKKVQVDCQGAEVQQEGAR